MVTYGSIHLDTVKNQWIMKDVKPNVCMKLKRVFPSIPEGAREPFRVSNEPSICADLEWFLSRFPMKISKSDRKELVSKRKIYETDKLEVENILSNSYAPLNCSGIKEGMVIRPHQLQAVNVLKIKKTLLLGDDVGLGKTYSGLSCAVSIENVLPAAVVVQAHQVDHWKIKAQEFTNLRVHVIKSGTPYALPAADLYIFRYGILSGWVDYFSTENPPFKLAIFDEIQEIRRGKETLKGNAVAALCASAEYKLALSATPIYNFGMEIFNIIDILKPGTLGTLSEFTTEWVSYDGKSVKDPDALGEHLRDIQIFLRRTKKQVGQTSKEPNVTIYNIDPNEKRVGDIQQRAKNLAMKVLGGSFTERGQAARDLDNVMRLATGVAKADGVADFCEMFLESRIPIILFGWHRDVYDIWTRRLERFNPLLYTGSETVAQKARNKERFLNGESDLFIMSLRSGVGTDGLQRRCSTVIFGELDWSPLVMNTQCVGRVDRDGQTEDVNAYYLISNFGSDPVMVEYAGIKTEQSTGIVDPNISDDLIPIVNNTDQIKKLARSLLTDQEYMSIVSKDKGQLENRLVI